MRLLINTATTFKGGSVQVAKSFIEECRKFPKNVYHIILGKRVSELLEIDSFPSNFFFYKIDYRPSERVFSVQSRSAYFKSIESIVEPDVVFTTSGPAYWKASVPNLIGFNLAHYLYPESPFFSIISLSNK